ncbi:ABC transporter permease subunit [Streptomyces sp. NPDC002185]|uniref:ABC transporter permease n=1 Tax=Streptomyces sp. NPDC002185 TaxID=3364636 RepID=UPI00368B5FE5
MRATGLGRRLVRLASPLVALGVWQLLTSLDVNLWLRFEQFPTVVEVASALADRIGTEAYWQDLGHSLRRITLGFLLAAVLGVAAGTAVARSRWAADVLGPLVEVVRPVPAIALVPVAILLLPTNEQGIVFITCAAAFFPVLVSTRHAVRALDPAWEEAVLTLGGSRARVLFSVVLPGSLPGVFGGLSVGIGVAWICVISAEMISGEYGVGYRTWQDYTVVDYPGVFVGMATIGVLGRLTSTAVEALGRRVTAWLPSPAEAGAAGPARPAPWGRTAPADAERPASPDADRAASPDPGLRVSPDPDRSASPDADRAAEHDGSSAPGSVRTPAAPPVPDKEPVR